MTVTRLARACGLSRTTVLYYETMGLLKARRNSGNYRVYGERRSGAPAADPRSIATLG